MKSIQKELQLGSLISLLVLMLLLWWITTNVIEQLSEKLILSRIQHDSDNVMAHLDASNDELDTHHLTVGPIFHHFASGHYFSISIDNKAPIVSLSLGQNTLATPNLAVGESHVWHSIGPNEQPILVWSSAYQKHQHKVLLSVAEDTTPLYQTLKIFNEIFAGITAVAALLLILIQRYLVRRSLKPLAQVRAEINQLEAGQISMITEQVPQEILPVVQELNRALEQLMQRVTRSRNAVGNMAHALKTPLNLIFRLAEQVHDTPTEQLARELRYHTEAIHQLIERELRRARLSGAGTPGRRFDPQEEVPTLATLLQQIYAGKKIVYQLPQNGIPHVYDRDDLLELLGNLLDNACKWAKQKVWLNIEYQCINNKFQLCILVQDDGKGCSADEIQLLTQRGVRIDEGAPGHGLGLSIVSEIVDLYHGKLDISPAEQGGLRVKVCLPGPEWGVPLRVA